MGIGRPFSHTACFNRRMRIRTRKRFDGQIVRAKQMEICYRLPEELKEGTLVKIISSDRGYFQVEVPHGRFQIYVLNVQDQMEH